jgi:hypothetical protein
MSRLVFIILFSIPAIIVACVFLRQLLEELNLEKIHKRKVTEKTKLISVEESMDKLYKDKNDRKST